MANATRYVMNSGRDSNQATLCAILEEQNYESIEGREITSQNSKFVLNIYSGNKPDEGTVITNFSRDQNIQMTSKDGLNKGHCFGYIIFSNMSTKQFNSLDKILDLYQTLNIIKQENL
jgi:hypothetical protein